MVGSTLGGVVVLALAAIFLFFVNPIIALVPLLLVVALLGLKVAARMFKHAQPSAATGDAPAVPSSEQASYEPVSDPSDRGV